MSVLRQQSMPVVRERSSSSGHSSDEDEYGASAAALCPAGADSADGAAAAAAGRAKGGRTVKRSSSPKKRKAQTVRKQLSIDTPKRAAAGVRDASAGVCVCLWVLVVSVCVISAICVSLCA